MRDSPSRADLRTLAAACAGPRTKEGLGPVEHVDLPRYVGARRIETAELLALVALMLPGVER